MMTDWIMIGITAVYVIATIYMCYSNFQSVKCAQEQMREMKVQGDLEKRWRIMPFIQVKKDETDEYVNGEVSCFLEGRTVTDCLLSEKIKFKVENIGHDVARDVRYEWERNEGKPIGYINSLPVGEKRIVEVHLHAYAKEEYNTGSTLIITYRDLLENMYQQRIHVYFRVTNTKIEFINTSIEAPQHIEKNDSFKRCDE